MAGLRELRTAAGMTSEAADGGSGHEGLTASGLTAYLRFLRKES